MKVAARNLEFEKAAALRDQVLDLRKALVLDEDAKAEEGIRTRSFKAKRAKRPRK